MKILKLPFVFIIMLISISGCYAQNDFSDKEAVAMLKEFYTIYNKEWNIDSGLVLKRRLDSLQGKYCTVQLVKKIREPNLDHDALIGDVFTDMEFLKTLVITKDPSKKNSFIVSYSSHTADPYTRGKYDSEAITLHVTLVKEKDKYKIDEVN